MAMSVSSHVRPRQKAKRCLKKVQDFFPSLVILVLFTGDSMGELVQLERAFMQQRMEVVLFQPILGKCSIVFQGFSISIFLAFREARAGHVFAAYAQKQSVCFHLYHALLSPGLQLWFWA